MKNRIKMSIRWIFCVFVQPEPQVCIFIQKNKKKINALFPEAIPICMQALLTSNTICTSECNALNVSCLQQQQHSQPVRTKNVNEKSCHTFTPNRIWRINISTDINTRTLDQKKKHTKVETKRTWEEEKYVGTCSRSIQSCQSIAWQRIGHCVHTMSGRWSRSNNDIEQYTYNTFVGNHIVYNHNECIIGCRYAENLFDLHWFWFSMDIG